MLNEYNNKNYNDLQNLIAKKMNLISEVAPPSTTKSKSSGDMESVFASKFSSSQNQPKIDSQRKEWEQKNPEEAKKFAEIEKKDEELASQNKVEWEKENTDRKTWWENEQNKKKASDWESKNPPPQNKGFDMTKWLEKRRDAGIPDEPESIFLDKKQLTRVKPWQKQEKRVNIRM